METNEARERKVIKYRWSGNLRKPEKIEKIDEKLKIYENNSML